MSDELNVNNPEEQVVDPTQGVEPAIEVTDEVIDGQAEVSPEVEEPEKEVPEENEAPKEEEVKEEEEPSRDEEEVNEPEKVEEEEPKEEPEQPKEEVEEPEEAPPEEDVEAIKRELEELKAIQKEEQDLKEFATKRDNCVNEYNEMCGRLANALQGEFEKYGIDVNKSLDDIAKEDPAKAEIAKGLIAQAQRIQEEQKAKVNQELNTAFTDIVFTKAARIMEKFNLTDAQQGIVAETFINIMENSGIRDLAEDLQAKVELAVAKAKMVAPAVVKAVEETKEAVEAIKEVAEVVQQEPLVEEQPKPQEPVVEPVAVDDFAEGVVERKDTTPAAALDESNVLQKLASLPHKERVAFYKENFDLITRASMKAAREHEQRLRNGETR